jgi:hypothetical protein
LYRSEFIVNLSAIYSHGEGQFVFNETLEQGMKPQLPVEIQDLLNYDVICVIYSFVPHLPKKEKPKEVSLSLQYHIMKIQRSPLRGKNEMYLKGFDDFILD